MHFAVGRESIKSYIDRIGPAYIRLCSRILRSHSRIVVNQATYLEDIASSAKSPSSHNVRLLDEILPENIFQRLGQVDLISHDVLELLVDSPGLLELVELLKRLCRPVVASRLDSEQEEAIFLSAFLRCCSSQPSSSLTCRRSSTTSAFLRCSSCVEYPRLYFRFFRLALDA